MKIGFATDHGGYVLKEPILKALCNSGLKVIDFGAYSLDLGGDYPDFVIPLAWGWQKWLQLKEKRLRVGDFLSHW